MFVCVALLSVSVLVAQEDKSKRPSPPATVVAEVKGKIITVNYSQPSVKGRTVWGDVVPYNKVWRAGANETTSIEFSDDVEIEGKPISKGKYALFVIPNEKTWTFVFNKTIKWGAFSYKQEEDVLRVEVPVKKSSSFNERLTYTVSDKGVVSLMWENAVASFKVK